ncbi:uncharacterized protein BDZ99DRAFT_427025 [Mytilinidion resinicola]|uniref:Integral membrane protein n=1 Tax=Mytilinidion resinicola TaxID=574789 RepID=A0A6A6Y4L7_9PEZI|nr:uncharacterized protein BDZ99DRAFT_427025 [Mytilinidion resinicola]KAF2803600.1 hypothetical protein BDZ99DRAFT_427025 [Mytilinidion resinicola]
MSFIQRVSSQAPADYTTPPWPSLYWPIPLLGPQSYYLYHPSDIWRFTIIWTLLLYAAIHFAVAGWATTIQLRNWKVACTIPPIYAIIGGIEGIVAGSVIGGLLGGVYNAGYYRMSTWIPFIWALINALVLILSSFAIQGGL